jgi:hypothetical protein
LDEVDSVAGLKAAQRPLRYPPAMVSALAAALGQKHVIELDI